MKSIARMTALALVFGTVCYSQISPDGAGVGTISSTPQYAIAIVAPPGPIRLGSPIIVVVTVTNVTGEDIYWASDRGKDGPYKGFVYSLKKDGREIETTFFHRKIKGRLRPDDPQETAGGSSVALPHPPGKMFTIPVDLTRLYKITEPGLYTFDVSRTDDDSKATVHSNTLTLEIGVK